MSTKWPILMAAFLFSTAPARPADPATGFRGRSIVDADGAKANYVLFVPHSYKPGTSLPIILFLHGSGETGKDGILPSRIGLGWRVRYEERTFPAFVIFPQSQKRSWQAASPDSERALRILEEVQTEYGTDPKRVYLTGLSMGGYGTWSLAAKYPEKWAAIVPVCGGGDLTAAESMKSIPCWAFHGDQDKAVPVEKSRAMIDALKKVGSSPKYTEYPGVGHASWDEAYAEPQLYEWLFRQRLK